MKTSTFRADGTRDPAVAFTYMEGNALQLYAGYETNMTPQEQQMLESFASRIANTPAPQKDADADALIRDRIGSKPDALYILTQTALIQEIALNQANQRLHDLQQ
jgi:hypothetical protein